MAQGRPLVLIAATLLLACLSTLTWFWNSGRQAPAIFWPALQQHPGRVMDAATIDFRASRGQIQGIDLAALQAALSGSPLEEEPFVFAAANLASGGDIAQAERLLRVALRRNPRSREARILLLDLLARRGNTQEAVAQIEVLSRLLPEQRAQLRNTLVLLASIPSTRRETLEAITVNANKIDVLRGLAHSGASASMLLESLDAVGEIDPGEDQEGFVNALVNPLVRAGDWQGALRLWTHFNPAAFAGGDLLLDPNFEGTFGPPFGWALRRDNQGYARFGEDGLVGEFYGRRRAEFARQVLLLEPGDYRLRVRSQDVGTGLLMEVECPGSGELASERLEERNEEMAFSVTQACPAQILKLMGRPSDPPRGSAFSISEIQIERVPS